MADTTTVTRMSAKNGAAMALLAACAVVFAMGAADGGEAKSRFLALCVGLRYPGTPSMLKYTTKDVKSVAAAFRAASGFDADSRRIEVLVDDEPTGAKPTPAEIRRRLAILADDAENEDRLVFYYSGHGLPGEGGRSILVAHGDGEADDESHLFLSDIKDIMLRSRAGGKLLIVDACYSGGKSGVVRGITPAGMAEAMGGGGGKAVGDQVVWLVSCGPSEKSYEDDDSGHGLFTRFLLEAVGPQAAALDYTPNGMISVAELHYFISNSIAAFILAKNMAGASQWRGLRQTPQVGVGSEIGHESRAVKNLHLFYIDESREDVERANARVREAIAAGKGVLEPLRNGIDKEDFRDMPGAWLRRIDDAGALSEASERFQSGLRETDADAALLSEARAWLGLCRLNTWKKWVVDSREDNRENVEKDPSFSDYHEKYMEVERRNKAFNSAAREDARYGEAVDLLSSAANAGNVLAMYELGCLHAGVWDGSFADRSDDDLDAAERFLAKAADKGYAPAMQVKAYLGLERRGIESKESWLEGVALFERAAEKGDVRAMFALSELYEGGISLPFSAVSMPTDPDAESQAYSDKEISRRWLRRSAEGGHAWAMYILGLKCVSDGLHAEAVRWYERAYAAGETAAAEPMSRIYAVGLGAIKRDFSKAAMWADRREYGQGRAKLEFGKIFYQGGKLSYELPEVAKDYAEAVKWFRLASDDDDNAVRGEANHYLGICHHNGEGVSKDYGKAFAYFMKGAEAGNAHDMFNVGLYYRNGFGVRQDRGEAARWFRKAAELGNAAAQKALDEL